MTTGYTREQLARLESEMDEYAPRIPTRADKIDAPRIVAMRAEGTNLGVLINFEFEGGRALVFWLHVVTASELAGAIAEAAKTYGWVSQWMGAAPADHLAPLTPENLKAALALASLSTRAVPTGLLANFFISAYGEVGATMIYFFPIQAAMEVATIIVSAGETAGWWGTDFELIPK
jgi:hypothetical protein